MSVQLRPLAFENKTQKGIIMKCVKNIETGKITRVSERDALNKVFKTKTHEFTSKCSWDKQRGHVPIPLKEKQKDDIPFVEDAKIVIMERKR